MRQFHSNREALTATARFNLAFLAAVTQLRHADATRCRHSLGRRNSDLVATSDLATHAAQWGATPVAQYIRTPKSWAKLREVANFSPAPLQQTVLQRNNLYNEFPYVPAISRVLYCATFTTERQVFWRALALGGVWLYSAWDIYCLLRLQVVGVRHSSRAYEPSRKSYMRQRLLGTAFAPAQVEFGMWNVF